MKRLAAATATILCAWMLHAAAQSSNQPIYIQYDGFIRNPDAKTLTLSFGYWNMNHTEIKVQPGPDNGFSPAPADRMQPITLAPGRHRFACTIVVPDDFKGDLKWSIVYNGKTYSSTEKILNPLYELELSSARRALQGLDPKTAPKNVCANHAPSVTVGAAAGRGAGGGDVAGVPDVGDDSAGPAETPTVTLTATTDQDLNIPAQVQDDDLPRGRTLTMAWKKVSGPGTVTFSTPAAATTKARFSAVGSYKLTLSATDGDRTTDTPVNVTVNAPGTTIVTEKAPDTYSKAMKDIQANQTKLRTTIGSKNYDGVSQAIAALQSSFTVAQQYWSGKDKQDATNQANNALKALADLDAAAKAKNDPKLIDAQTALNRTCTSCHAAHRQSVGQGAFEIK